MLCTRCPPRRGVADFKVSAMSKMTISYLDHRRVLFWIASMFLLVLFVTLFVQFFQQTNGTNKIKLTSSRSSLGTNSTLSTFQGRRIIYRVPRNQASLCLRSFCRRAGSLAPDNLTPTHLLYRKIFVLYMYHICII